MNAVTRSPSTLLAATLCFLVPLLCTGAHARARDGVKSEFESESESKREGAGAVEIDRTSIEIGAPTPYSPQFTATISVLGEVDTNARRIATDPVGAVENKSDVVADALMRGQASLGAVLSRPGRQFQARLDVGGKMFVALAAERMAVAQLQASADLAVAPRLAIFARYFSKARTQVSGARSYTVHRGDVGADIFIVGPLSLRPSLYGAGFHGFGTPQFSSVATGGGAAAAWRITTQERASLSANAGVRAYPFAFPIDDDGVVVGAGRRLDVPLRVTIRASTARLIFVSVSYTFLRNASNSFGESYTRHRMRALLGTRLPASVTLSGQGSIQLTAYDQGVSVGQRLLLGDDDESQNAFQVKLSRPLLEGIVVEGRVAFYGNELAREGLRFSRTTLSFGLRANL